METETITGSVLHTVQQSAAVSMLKKSMNMQQQAVLKLMQNLPLMQDPELGNNIDTYA